MDLKTLNNIDSDDQPGGPNSSTPFHGSRIPVKNSDRVMIDGVDGVDGVDRVDKTANPATITS